MFFRFHLILSVSFEILPQLVKPNLFVMIGIINVVFLFSLTTQDKKKDKKSKMELLREEQELGEKEKEKLEEQKQEKVT